MQDYGYAKNYKGEGHTFRKFKDGDDKPLSSYSGKIFENDTSYKCPTYVHQTPPCQGSCPSGHDIRGWLAIVNGIEKSPEGTAMSQYAFLRAVSSNPFPSVMGRVCPAPCEDGCNRNMVEDFVGINSIEQWIGDTALEEGYNFDDLVAKTETGKKIAIIGGGPAGLAAAFQLRILGHGCTIFEYQAELGGMMKYGIPGYRTPNDLLDKEIKRITDMGVEVRLNTKVGVDVSLDALEKDYDAILFAQGAQSGRALPIPGAEADNCITGVAFLEAFNQGRLHHITGKIVVVGGGDTSIDVSSVARRLGHIDVVHAKDRPEHIIFDDVAHDVADVSCREGADVTLISRSNITNLNAAQQEIDDALSEGVHILGQLNPVSVVLNDNGRAVALRVQKLGEDGKTPIEGSEYDIEAELIVSAIGQGAGLEGMEEFSNDRGLVSADKHYQIPNKPGYFVCGDVIRPHLLTTAIGQANIAVQSINTYVNEQSFGHRPKVDVHFFDLLDKLQEGNTNHESLAPGEFVAGDVEEDDGDHLRGTDGSDYAVHNYENRSFASIIPSDELFLGHFDDTPRVKRDHMSITSDNVLGNFEERIVNLNEEQAVEESGRCMSCGMCFECDNCVIYCPQDAVFRVKKNDATLGRYVDTDYGKCIGCHICADVCPTGYIQMGLGA